MDNKEDEIIVLLKEILKWTKFQGMQNLKKILEDTLESDSERIAYHLSDGRPPAEIAKLSGVSDQTIRNWWKQWYPMGLIEPAPTWKGRFRKVFSLEDLGIEIPKMESAEG